MSAHVLDGRDLLLAHLDTVGLWSAEDRTPEPDPPLTREPEETPMPVTLTETQSDLAAAIGEFCRREIPDKARRDELTAEGPHPTARDLPPDGRPGLARVWRSPRPTAAPTAA